MYSTQSHTKVDPYLHILGGGSTHRSNEVCRRCGTCCHTTISGLRLIPSSIRNGSLPCIVMLHPQQWPITTNNPKLQALFGELSDEELETICSTSYSSSVPIRLGGGFEKFRLCASVSL